MADIEFDVITVAEVGIPARVEPNLKEVVEGVVYVVLSFNAATVATKLKNKSLRTDVFEPHDCS